MGSSMNFRYTGVPSIDSNYGNQVSSNKDNFWADGKVNKLQLHDSLSIDGNYGNQASQSKDDFWADGKVNELQINNSPI